MADAMLSSHVRSAHSFATQFEKANPELAAELAELASSDAKIYATVLKFCASQNRQAARQSPAATQQQQRSERQMVEPILSEKEMIQDRINEMSKNLSTEKTPAFWREWTALHERLHGTDPIPGRGGNSIR
jgi:hypothetical protein